MYPAGLYTKCVMFLLVIMGLVLVLMETVMDPVGFYWSLSIGGLLKPINPNGISLLKKHLKQLRPA